MNRPVVALSLALGSAVLLAPPAPAAPVASNRLAGVDVEVLLADGGSRRIDLRVTSAGRFTLQVTDCEGTDCYGFRYYETRLPGSAVSVDADEARATLRTSLAGQPLTVSWEPTGEQAVVVGGTEGSSNDEGETFSSYVADPATATVTWGEQTCEQRGLVGDEVRVESPEGNDGAAVPLAQLRLRGTLAC